MAVNGNLMRFDHSASDVDTDAVADGFPQSLT
jgi:hypothetical protein